jgi:hypothetical protein
MSTDHYLLPKSSTATDLHTVMEGRRSPAQAVRPGHQRRSQARKVRKRRSPVVATPRGLLRLDGPRRVPRGVPR